MPDRTNERGPDPELKPARVAVIGAGPSGFFTAGALLGLRDLDVSVDLFDRLPTPWGLVRSGVAPDHPKIKSVSAVFEKTAAHERFRFFGNVDIGRDMTRDELLARYDAVVYATGAQTDKTLGVPGEELPGTMAASAFVGWYNGHPDHHALHVDLSSERAVIVGNGNVALDIARILVTPPDRLANTDIADRALHALATSRVREVVVVGRRGPAQGTFTTPELEELAALTGAKVLIDPEPTVAEALAELPDDAEPRVRRNLEVLQGYVSSTPDGEDDPHQRRLVLRFLSSPVELQGSVRVERVVLGANELIDDAGAVRAVDTGRRAIVEAGLVVTAVGYTATPVDRLPIGHDGSVPNQEGRVSGHEREYVVGWAKRGPSGVIGMNKKCAVDTVRAVADDLRLGARIEAGDDVESWLRARQPDLVTGVGWAAIDASERDAGSASGRPRVKHCTYDALLAAASAT